MSKAAPGIVTLITDFGVEGEYAGAMKGAVLKVNPRCQIVDITHQIKPQDILRASFVLKNSYAYYPTGTVHVVVVDPGVGTCRRPLILQKDGHIFVGPDNGVFTFLLSGKGKIEGFEITRKELFLSPLSKTFHGRDLFAPIAGHLSLGQHPKRFGPRAGNFARVEWPQPQIQGRKLVAQILFADSFGNLITNIGGQDHEGLIEGQPLQISGPKWRIDRLSGTYGGGKPGQPIALFGSSGMLEIAVNCGNAEKSLGLRPGDRLAIIFSPSRLRQNRAIPILKSRSEKQRGELSRGQGTKRDDES